MQQFHKFITWRLWVLESYDDARTYERQIHKRMRWNIKTAENWF
jgi:hypothetical protein